MEWRPGFFGRNDNVFDEVEGQHVANNSKARASASALWLVKTPATHRKGAMDGAPVDLRGG